jgi:hypothetical protein
MRFREAKDKDSFIISREGKICSDKTVEWCELMLDKFENYLRENDIMFDKVRVDTLRLYLRYLGKEKKYSDKYLLDHFRVYPF